MFQSSSGNAVDNIHVDSNLNRPTGSVIFTDVGSSTSVERSSTGGDVGNIVNAANTAESVGLLFYQQGIAVFDLKKIFWANQHMSGSIDCVGDNATTVLNTESKFIPQFITSASIDQFLKHVTETRFGSGSNTFITFQNNTKINSTLYFCRAPADEMNFSSNPTYTNSEGRIRVIDTGQEDIE